MVLKVLKCLTPYHLYSNQLSESIKKSDYRRMITAGNVLVALMRRQVDILSQRVDSRE